MFDGRFRARVDKGVSPIGSALQRTGLSPDHLTALGLVLAVPAAIAIGTGRLVLGLILLIASAIPDLLDGALAKASGTASVRGAFFDSVADRVTDGLILGGVAWYLQSSRHGHAALLPFAILAASMLISYERAKAESLGFNAKGGLMERAERIIVLCIGLVAPVILVPLLWTMLVLTLVTAVQRFVKVWRQATLAGSPGPAVADERVRHRDQGSSVRAGSIRPDRAVRLDGEVVRRTADPQDLTVAVGERWRAWRESNGWSAAARPERYAHGNRHSARWEERRQARLDRLDPDGSPRGPLPRGRRPGSRRP